MNNFIAIGQALSKFQLIEGALKAFLIKHQIEQDKLNKNSKVFYSIAKHNDISYGVLLKRYKKIGIDQSWLNRLFELKDYRNYLAHQAFIANLENVDSGFKQFLGVNPILIDYDLLNKELDECVDLMIEEYDLLVKNP